MILPAWVSSAREPEKRTLTYVMLDTMSSVTMVSEELLKKLNVDRQPTTLNLNTITDTNKPVNCDRISGLLVHPHLSKDNEEEVTELRSAFSTDNLQMDQRCIPTRDSVKNQEHLKRLVPELSGRLEIEIGLLIGYDHFELLQPLEVIAGSPYAVRTKLGWTVVGSSPTALSGENVFCTAHSKPTSVENVEGETVHFIYKAHLSEPTLFDALHVLESDFVERETGSKSQEDIQFMQILGEKIRVNSEGHYEMPLPFRSSDPSLPDNRASIEKRFHSLSNSLNHNPQKKADYCKFMSDIVSNGHAEKVPLYTAKSDKRWYIPHHGVYNEHKPGKIRVVYDCSASYKDESLNRHLLQGPDLMNSLVGVLCRFRKGNTAFACDVEKMFHQFHVVPEHRDYLRFLWWKENEIGGQVEELRMKVHLFGAVSSPGCANYGLQQIARDHAEVDKDAANFLQEDFYVDDGLHAEDDTQSGVHVLKKAIEICEKGKLRLHKIVSNDPQLLEQFPISERQSVKQHDLISSDESNPVQRTLGVQWDTESDCFFFSHQPVSKPETRRGVLSTIATLYDPLGLVSPVILKGKCILQRVCRSNTDWDAELSPEDKAAWREWLKQLDALEEVKIPRSFSPFDFGKVVSVELHHFCDASQDGYGEVSYLRLKTDDERVHCSLVMSKGRVAPLKTVTIPRLELQAAVLAVHMSTFLEKQLKYTALRHHFWTDSMIVLGYIANQHRRFHVFVANRVSQICQSTSKYQWSHIATEENPADHVSRGRTVQQLKNSNWYSGPDFLWNPALNDSPMTDAPLAEQSEVFHTHATSATETTSLERDFITKYSSFKKLVSVTAVILRFWAILKRTREEHRDYKALAFRTLARQVQRENTPAPRSAEENMLKKLNCRKTEDGVLVVGGRLENSQNERQKNPIILPRDSHLTKIFVKYCHEKVAHQGRTTTIHEVRVQGAWIVGIRRVASSVVKNCVHCKRHYAKTLTQKMAELPDTRVNESPPFSHCGIDVFGPFHVIDSRKTLKRYGLVVTCLASRAIHLEMLEDMTTDACISALRRVVAIRGKIQSILSDQGTNFVGAARELEREWNKMRHDLSRECPDIHWNWTFQPPAASHFGGVWERQIRTVRRVLTGILSKHGARLTSFSLNTLFYEVMAIVNSRPLSVESLEDPSSALPITPNHILTSKTEGVLPPPGVFEQADVYCRRAWRKVQFLADEFWRSWRTDYLAALQVRRKWLSASTNLKVGDVVVVLDDAVSRSEWKMAVVTETIPSSDGLVRRCRVMLPDDSRDAAGKGRPGATRRALERPISKLILLLAA